MGFTTDQKWAFALLLGIIEDTGGDVTAFNLRGARCGCGNPIKEMMHIGGDTAEMLEQRTGMEIHLMPVCKQCGVAIRDALHRRKAVEPKEGPTFRVVVDETIRRVIHVTAPDQDTADQMVNSNTIGDFPAGEGYTVMDRSWSGAVPV